MNMSNLIEEFLKHWPEDKHLWSPICNRIGKGHFDIELEGGNELNISLNTEVYQNDEDTSFWKDNIIKYAHLYVFVLLDFWKGAYPNSESIKNRFESYSKEKEIEIIAEFEKFIIQSDNAEFLNDYIRLVIVVFSAMDSYLWNSKRRTPILLAFLKKHNISTDNLYERYYSLLAQSLLKSPELIENMDLLFAFCDSTDGVTHKSNCFRLIIEKIHGEGVDSLDIATLLMTMPKDKCSTKTYIALLDYYCVNIDIYKENDSDFLPVCLSSEERKFCIEKLKSDKYTLLLPYVIIKNWNCEGKFKGKLRPWIKSIQGEEYKNHLEQEMNEFLQQIQTTFVESKLINIIKKIGFAIDSYFFISQKSTPFLFEILNNNTPLLKDLYSKYVNLLSKQIKSYNREDIKNSIEFIIQFCKATDVPIKKSNSLRALLQFISGLYNEKNLSSMLIKTLKEEPRNEEEYFGFDVLKSIVDFYCANSNIYLSSRDHMDIFNVSSMQHELWEIRIGDYLFKFDKFITSEKIMGKNVAYPEGICTPFSDMDSFAFWRRYAKPWNYIDFYSKDNFKKIKHIIGDNLLHNINSELDSKAQNVIKKAIEKSRNKEWANDRLRHVTKCAIEKRIEKFCGELFSFLVHYKTDKIEEYISKAFEDSRLQLWIKSPLNKPDIEIKVVNNDSLTERNIVISIIYEAEKIEMSFLDIPSKEIEPLKKMYSNLPYSFISSYIDSYRKTWGRGWNDIPDTSKKEKSMENLNTFLKEFKNLAQMAVICYLDFSYMDAVNKKENREHNQDYSTNRYAAETSSPLDRSDYMWGLVGG